MIVIGNPISFEEYPLERALDLMVELGYEGVEICHSQLGKFRTDPLRAEFASHVASCGLKLVGSNVAAADYFGPLSSQLDKERVVRGLKEDIDIAAAMGVHHVLTWEGVKPEGATREDVHGWIFDATANIFQEAVAYAAKLGTTITVEVHPFTLGMDLEFLTRLCDTIGSERFGVTYDCCHFGVGMPEGYIGAIRTLGHRIKHVHFSDSDTQSSELHFAPKKGCLNLPGIVSALKEIQFSGPIMLDLYLYPLPIEGSRTGVPYLRDVIAALKDSR